MDYLRWNMLNPLGKSAMQDPDAYKMFKITRDFDPAEQREIKLAVRYWDERMKNIPADKANIFTGVVENPDRSASSLSPAQFLDDSLIVGMSPNGSVYDKFILGRPGSYPPGLGDNIIIFNSPYSPSQTRLLMDNNSIFATMLHELGHALGIMGMKTITNASGTEGVFNEDKFTAWNAHLRDVYGKDAKPDMKIAMYVTNVGDPDLKLDTFGVFAQDAKPEDYKYVTFHGAHVDALTGGKGMPVMGAWCNDGNFMDGGNSLGHPGVMSSIMSYGIVGNMVFTEMELAAFQDMGYDIDRSQFFGKSYYYNVDGDTQINTTGFGTAANPNNSMFGVGTHILRDDLTLTQAADVYANGYGAGGIRIDGVNNSLFIPQGVTVAVNGPMGTGLLVAYGGKNTLRLDGKVEALGPGGIGAHFGILASSAIRSYIGKPDFTLFEKEPAIETKAELLKVMVVGYSLSGSSLLGVLRAQEDTMSPETRAPL
jgi:hypothetical protein